MSNPKNGRKFCSIAWKIWEGYELTSQAVRKSGAKFSIPLEDKEDTEIDEGFEHILQHAPRSSCEVAQLQWQTKGLWSTQSLVGFLLLSARPFVTSPQMERLPGKSSTGPFLSFQSIFKLEHIWDRSPLYPRTRFFARRTRFKSHGRFFLRHVFEHDGHEACDSEGFPGRRPLWEYDLGMLGCQQVGPKWAAHCGRQHLWCGPPIAWRLHSPDFAWRFSNWSA